MKGFIKLPRSFLQWEWWNRQPHLSLFLWLLIKAHITDQKIQGILVRRGSVLTTWNELQNATGCSRGALSRALKDLLDSGEIITRTDCKKTVIIICHYEDYNGGDNTLWTDSGLTADCQRTDTHLIKGEIENEKDIYSASARDFSDDGFVSESDCRAWMRRYNRIAAAFGAPPADKLTDKRILKIQQRVRERGRGSVDIMFQRLEQSAYFFADGSHGFRGDFTNLWSSNTYTRVIEGNFIPNKPPCPPHQRQEAPKEEKPPTGSWLDDYHEEKRATPSERQQQMRQYAREHPDSYVAKMVADWDKEKQVQTPKK